MSKALQVKELVVTAGKPVPLLAGVSASVEAGECLAVVGGAGSGKSMLVKAISGLIPSQGEVIAGGVSSRTQGWDAVRARLGVLLGQPGLLDDMDVFDNVAHRLRRAGMAAADIDKAVTGILTEFDLLTHRNKMPDQLSGGMKRRVALARALVHGPACLLLDDPTAGLDPITTTLIMDFVLQVAKQHETAVLVTTHDLNRVAKRANRVVLLRRGRLTPLSGDPQQWAKELGAP